MSSIWLTHDSNMSCHTSLLPEFTFDSTANTLSQSTLISWLEGVGNGFTGLRALINVLEVRIELLPIYSNRQTIDFAVMSAILWQGWRELPHSGQALCAQWHAIMQYVSTSCCLQHCDASYCNASRQVNKLNNFESGYHLVIQITSDPYRFWTAYRL